MEIEQLIWELNAKHYDQIRKSLQVVISPKDITMNPNLTANLRAEAELKADIERDELKSKLLRLTEIGWKIGSYKALNQPISYQALQHACKSLFDERDQLIAC